LILLIIFIIVVVVDILADRTAARRLLWWYCRLSVWPSVCDAVHCGAYRVGVGVESCTAMLLEGHFLFTSSDTFAACRMYL